LLLRQALNLILHVGLHLGLHLDLHLDIRQLHFPHLSGQRLRLLRSAVRLDRGVILGRAPPPGRLPGMLSFELGQSLGRRQLGQQPIVCRSQFGRCTGPLGREGDRCFCLNSAALAAALTCPAAKAAATWACASASRTCLRARSFAKATSAHACRVWLANSASRATPCTRSDAAETTAFVWACSVWLTATSCISRRTPWLAASMATCAKAVNAPFASRGTAGFRSGLDRFCGLLATLPSEAPDTASDAPDTASDVKMRSCNRATMSRFVH
jgi:hypothetical protein